MAGRLVCAAIRATETIRADVVQTHHGFADANANLLIATGPCDPVTGSSPARSTPCRIRAA